jgi:hypothetical protein
VRRCAPYLTPSGTQADLGHNLLSDRVMLVRQYDCIWHCLGMPVMPGRDHDLLSLVSSFLFLDDWWQWKATPVLLVRYCLTVTWYRMIV